MAKNFTFMYDGKEYSGIICFRHGLRRISFRIVEGKMKISAPTFVSAAEIKKHLATLPNDFMQKLEHVPVLEKGYIYILGEKIVISQVGENSNEPQALTYKNEKDLLKKLHSLAVELLTKRTRIYEEIMGISRPYHIRVRKMSSRYGSNSSATHCITYNLKLLEKPLEAIDAIVVHELAHDRHRDHSPSFYEEVLKYYPQYKKAYKKLKEINE